MLLTRLYIVPNERFCQNPPQGGAIIIIYVFANGCVSVNTHQILISYEPLCQALQVFY